MPRSMVAQHHAITPERANPMFEVDLHKAALAGADRPRVEHCRAANEIGRAEMEMHRQPVAQRRLGTARDTDRQIEPRGRRMPLRREDPVAAARLAALRKRPGNVDRTTLARNGVLYRAIVGMQAANAHGNAAWAGDKAVAWRHRARRNGAGDNKANTRQGEGTVDGHPEETRDLRRHPLTRGEVGTRLKIPGERRDTIPGPARHWEN